MTLSYSGTNLIVYDYEFNTGNGIVILDSEFMEGFFNCFQITCDSTININIYSELLQDDIYTGDVYNCYKLLRCSATSKEDEEFNYSHELLPCIGKLRITLKGKMNVSGKLKIVIQNG